ncbi:HPr family phosphocarrier protein [Anoxybacterium hadale]|uniref:HPr family phosphocarrier protein n=1 Tax=Anoxybacterium hadale TaxID=3408580 RepID=A0ACD1A8Y6_9FIRM|nr:HPr family phosphocarrier protein [Clostridiales bacterium]
MISKVITITNNTGLHARPASVFVSTASKFKSELFIKKEEKKVNAKSILAVLALGISKGTEITLTAEGPDEEEAVAAILALAEANFNE